MTEKFDNGDETEPPVFNPFFRKWLTFKHAEHEMRYLKAFAPARIEEISQSIPGFAELKSAYNFYVHNNVEMTVQASFGNRLMGRRTLKGVNASENGPTLVYSQGPTGNIVILLYPPSSELGSVYEKLIILRKQERSAMWLMDGLRRDIKDLIAYAHVASIDGNPNWRQRWRIQWLRLTRTSQRVEDFPKVTMHRPVTDFAKKLPTTFAASAVTSLIKLILPFLLGAVFGFFGLQGLSE